jgi:predicted sulfurtransferase
MTPRKPRLGDRPLHSEPCRHCSQPFQPTEWQIQNRSLMCPACREDRARAAEARRLKAHTADRERNKGYALAQHLQQAWRHHPGRASGGE